MKSPAKGVGPKIVAVTGVTPRPLIVQVQSLTQPPVNQGLDLTNDVNDIPSGNLASLESILIGEIVINDSLTFIY